VGLAGWHPATRVGGVTGRRELMLPGVDIATAKGLEIGPLANPLVRREDGPIHYIDHASTDDLRAHYATHEGFDVAAIVDIDHVIGDGTIAAAAGDAAPFGYVVASHVIEHMPDLIGSLQDIRSVLADGGVLGLAVPDHRRCFDALRSPTVVADLVAAHLAGARTPSARQVFDHYSSAVQWRGQISWGEEPPFDELVPVHTEAEALEHARRAAASADYDDVHCWVFTPASFRRIVAGLQRLDLLPFELVSCSEPSGGEFFATLRATDHPVPSNAAGVAARWSEHAALRADLARLHARTIGARARRLRRVLRR
jgi:SAM-dependent methyltransferase